MEILENSDSRYPFLTPIVGLLRSRKFMVGVLAVIAAMVVGVVPAFNDFEVYLLFVITTAAVANILGIAYEDAARIAGQVLEVAGIDVDEEALREKIMELLEAIISDQQGETEVSITTTTTDNNVDALARNVVEKVRKIGIDSQG